MKAFTPNACSFNSREVNNKFIIFSTDTHTSVYNVNTIRSLTNEVSSSYSKFISLKYVYDIGSKKENDEINLLVSVEKFGLRQSCWNQFNKI